MTHPIPFVLAASNHGPMIVNRLDFHQLPNGATYGVGHQILTRGAYDPGEIDEVLEILAKRHQNLGSGVVALDCGANIGVHTVEMARYMRNWGQVIAIEAQERLYYALCGNIALGNLFNASAILGAVSSTEGWLDIPKPNYNKPASFGSVELVRRPSTEYVGQSISYAWRDCQRVRTVTIDSVCAGLGRVDFIKIDIEGMEIEALRGAERTLGQFRPVLLIEWIKSNRDELQSFLESKGYLIEEHGANLLATCDDV